MMKQVKIFFVLLMLFCAVSLYGQENLLLHYDFSLVEGTTVKDVSSTGADATLRGAATVEQMGQHYVLNLGSGSGYLDMGQQAGKTFASIDDYTISVYYYVEDDASLSGNGYFLWSFSTSTACASTTGVYSAYRLNAQRMATSTGGYSNETGYSVGTASKQGRWMHVAYTQTGSTGKLYINGELKSTISGMPLNSVIFATTKPAYNWIGRAPFTSDYYLTKTLVADFRLYDGALNDTAVKELASGTEDLTQDYKYGTPGDFTLLGEVLQECNTFLSTSADADYAPNAVAQLRDVVTIAQKEYDARRISQRLIDNRVASLQNTLQLVKDSKGFAYSKLSNFEAGTQGFRHPGGLHTQTDFDRIKQALADGDERITSAWQKLCGATYAQASVATYPVETITRGGSGTQNYMNVARGAAMAYQNALRWRIGGTTDNADGAVRILMAWARGNKYVGGDTNMSLAAGLYGYQLAQAAELMRDYEGWSREDFEEFKRYMMTTWYPKSLDFLRRRHDTWSNKNYPAMGERPGHYWSNWGLCNTLCLMSIGILCDDVHIYNQGVSFYKYDHVGTYQDHTNSSVILNDGCNEFIGNLVPVVLPDERGPLGYLGQMQESGRDQGHTLMALGLAVDICQVAYNQGDDLFGYMDDRLAAGIEHVAALNFGGVAATDLPWKTYNYADCRTTMGSGWGMSAPNTGSKGDRRPYWDRILGYYEGIRGIKMQYAEKASQSLGVDMGGGSYGTTSGGFDHLGFSTLTSYRPLIDASQAPVVLHGDIIYAGDTLRNQTNLGGLKYTYNWCKSKAVAANDSLITLVPQLPDSVEDTGQWQWNTGEQTRRLTVKADHSYVYRVTYTAANGVASEQAFMIAVAGDCQADQMTQKITADEVQVTDSTAHVLYGDGFSLYAGNSTGWTNDYHWDNGTTGQSTATIPVITSDRDYICQYINMGGYVNEVRYHIVVDKARQHIITGGAESETNSVSVLKGTSVTLRLVIPATADADEVKWMDGSCGTTFSIDSVTENQTITADFEGITYTYTVTLNKRDFSYYKMLTTERGYTLVTSTDQLSTLVSDHYFVLASDDADLLISLADAPLNGNKALFFSTPKEPVSDLTQLFTMESYNNGFSLRNVDYDALLLQTEMNRPDQLRTHDQPKVCSWSRLLFSYDGNAWTVENGVYSGNWLGLWNTEDGYCDGEEIALNKTGLDIAHLQIFAISKVDFNATYLAGASEAEPKDASALLVCPKMAKETKIGWSRDNCSASGYSELQTSIESDVHKGYGISHWRSSAITNSKLIYQSISDLPAGDYKLEAYAAATLWNSNNGGANKDGVTLFLSTPSAETDTPVTTAKYDLYAATIHLNDGEQLTLGLRAGAKNTNTWMFLSDVTLLYMGENGTGINEVEDEAVNTNSSNSHYYDLQGRRLADHPQGLPKGIYIYNGKKVLVK